MNSFQVNELRKVYFAATFAGALLGMVLTLLALAVINGGTLSYIATDGSLRVELELVKRNVVQISANLDAVSKNTDVLGRKVEALEQSVSAVENHASAVGLALEADHYVLTELIALLGFEQ